MVELVDLNMTCIECNNPFVIPVGEQKWLSEKFGADFSPPRRCKNCRARRKQLKQQG